MNPRDARDRLTDRFTVLRSDPFILDAAVYVALERLAVAMHDQYHTRRAWEEGAGTAQRPHLERIHRLAWRDLLAKVEAAAMAAGFDMAPTGEPQSASEAIVGVGVQVETNRRSDARRGSAGRGLRPSPKVRQEEM